MSVPISWPAHYRAVWETLALLVIGVATGGVGELEMLRGSSTRRSAADRVVEDNHFFSKAVATRWDGGHGLPESGDLEEMMPTAGQSVTGSTRQRFVRRRTRRTRYSGSRTNVLYTVQYKAECSSQRRRTHTDKRLVVCLANRCSREAELESEANLKAASSKN